MLDSKAPVDSMVSGQGKCRWIVIIKDSYQAACGKVFGFWPKNNGKELESYGRS